MRVASIQSCKCCTEEYVCLCKSMGWGVTWLSVSKSLPSYRMGSYTAVDLYGLYKQNTPLSEWQSYMGSASFCTDLGQSHWVSGSIILIEQWEGERLLYTRNIAEWWVSDSVGVWGITAITLYNSPQAAATSLHVYTLSKDPNKKPNGSIAMATCRETQKRNLKKGWL